MVEKKFVFDPMSAAIRAWIAKNGAASIKTILATNLEDVKGVILAGVDENLTTVQIGRNLRQFYTDRSPFKSMRVARTETSHAAGFSQREAARQSGVVKTKQWISSRDDRVRDEHLAMDSDSHYEAVPFNEPYPNGDMYPGENSIMCRCAESYGTR
uniref:Putative capsid morphogenesis protein n=1 Tax=viral metagenome TaxID=1070528 RepID=A0A6M3KUY3_9ZZZZ